MHGCSDLRTSIRCPEAHLINSTSEVLAVLPSANKNRICFGAQVAVSGVGPGNNLCSVKVDENVSALLYKGNMGPRIQRRPDFRNIVTPGGTIITGVEERSPKLSVV